MSDQSGQTQNKWLSTLGLCARARGLIIGTPMVCDALRAPAKGQKVLAVLEASDTSANTHEKLTSKCAYYGVPLHRLSVTTEALAHAIGKSGATAAVGVTHEGLWQAMQKYLDGAGDPLTDR